MMNKRETRELREWLEGLTPEDLEEEYRSAHESELGSGAFPSYIEQDSGALEDIALKNRAIIRMYGKIKQERATSKVSQPDSEAAFEL